MVTPDSQDRGGKGPRGEVPVREVAAARRGALSAYPVWVPAANLSVCIGIDFTATPWRREYLAVPGRGRDA
jgi:hypothetical protein